MRRNFYGSDPTYHEARRRFVYKGTVDVESTLQCHTPRGSL